MTLTHTFKFIKKSLKRLEFPNRKLYAGTDENACFMWKLLILLRAMFQNYTIYSVVNLGRVQLHLKMTAHLHKRISLI